MAEYEVTDLLAKIGRRTKVRSNGPHILRHTFCSHLAMRGAPARAIQEAAGHRDLATTQTYMDLIQTAVADAIRLLDRWIENFNRNQTRPTATQLQRIGALLDSAASRMPEETARMLRFSIKPL